VGGEAIPDIRSSKCKWAVAAASGVHKIELPEMFMMRFLLKENEVQRYVLVYVQLLFNVYVM